MKISHLILIVMIGLVAQTHAQEASKRNCRILFLDRPDTAPKSLYLFDGATSQQVDLPSMNLSPVYKIASNTTQIKLLPEQVDKPEAISPDAPDVQIPEEYTNILLLVSSDSENKIAPVKITSIHLNFKVGQSLWINRTDKHIGGKLGEQTLALEPQGTKIIDAPQANQDAQSNGYFEASFTYRKKDSDVFLPISEQRWWHDPKSRYIGVVEQSGVRLPKINFFRDFRDDAAEEKSVE